MAHNQILWTEVAMHTLAGVIISGTSSSSSSKMSLIFFIHSFTQKTKILAFLSDSLYNFFFFLRQLKGSLRTHCEQKIFCCVLYNLDLPSLSSLEKGCLGLAQFWSPNFLRWSDSLIRLVQTFTAWITSTSGKYFLSAALNMWDFSSMLWKLSSLAVLCSPTWWRRRLHKALFSDPFFTFHILALPLSHSLLCHPLS